MSSFFTVLKSILFCLSIIVAIVFFDLYSKKYIFDLLHYYATTDSNGNPQIALTSYLSMVYVSNNGISFGMFDNFANGKIIFATLQAGIAILLLFFMLKTTKIHKQTAFALIIGGAFGNVIDRLQNGGVTDFIDFHLYGYHWPAFNLADSSIFVGVAILVIDELFFKEKQL